MKSKLILPLPTEVYRPKIRNHFHFSSKYMEMTQGLVYSELICRALHCSAGLLTVVQSLSCVWLFVTPWTVARQAPLSMRFSRQEYWSGLPFPSPGDLHDPGIELACPTLPADSLQSEPQGKPINILEKGNRFKEFNESWKITKITRGEIIKWSVPAKPDGLPIATIILNGIYKKSSPKKCIYHVSLIWFQYNSLWYLVLSYLLQPCFPCKSQENKLLKNHWQSSIRKMNENVEKQAETIRTIFVRNLENCRKLITNKQMLNLGKGNTKW